MPIRAVVFDLFDTLVDLRWEDFPKSEIRGRRFASSMDLLHQEVSRHRPMSREDFTEQLIELDQELRRTHHDVDVELPTLKRFTALAERLELDAPELPTTLTEIQMALFRRHSPAPSHHAELLAELAQRFRLGLCSNFSHSETALSVLQEHNLRLHFDTLVVSEAVGLRKPHPEIFRAVLGPLGVTPEETLHVGDSLKADVAGASRVGMRTAWVTRRIEDPDQQLAEHEGPEPDHRIADLAELRELLADEGG